MIIVSLDVGYINMGITKAIIDDDFNLTFTEAFKIDLTRTIHKKVAIEECTIPHTKETCDRVAHFLQEHESLFNEADHVLIERQPIMGMKDVEGLIMSRFRHKTTLVSPNKMHKFFNIRHLDYDERKVATEQIADLHIGHIHTYANCARKHDMADAVCICIVFVHAMKREHELKQKYENMKRLPFDEYRLIPK